MTKMWLMSNIGKLKLHPAVDKRNFFTFFLLKSTRDASQSSLPVQSNVNASTFSISGQIYFELSFVVFRFFSEAKLSIVATPHRLTVVSSNNLGIINQLSKSMILLSQLLQFYFFIFTPWFWKCLLLNNFFIDSKEYLIVSSSLHVELLVSYMKLQLLVLISMEIDPKPVSFASE